MGFSFRWPWPRVADAPDAPDPHAGLRQAWDEQGFVVLPGFYDEEELAAAEAPVRQAWEEKAPRVVVDDLVTGQRLRLSDVSDEARSRHRFKTNDLYLEQEAVRRLALNERITPILTALLGRVPVLCNSLSFEQGSAQTDHVDALFMTPRTPHHLLAIWVALEDCHPDSGPLKYFAGSHRIEPWVFSTGSHHFVLEEMPAWRAYMDEQVAQRGLQPQVFPARRGDVFIWSAYLLHGGSPIRDPARTRKSVVFHYYSQEDCIAQRCTIVPYQGGFWMHRPHQAVPGLGESPAPPLPPDARLPPQD